MIWNFDWNLCSVAANCSKPVSEEPALYLLPCAHVYKLKSQLVEADFDGDFSVWMEKELYEYESGILIKMR